MEIDISKESKARKQEEPLFRAMFLANIDRFDHPDITNIPTIDGKQFTIELKDGIDTEPLILKTGFGFQMLKSKWWALELKIGFGNRNDFRNDMDKKYLVPDLELSFYRVIWKNSHN